MSPELSERVSAAQPVSPLPHHLLCSSCSNPLFNAFQTPHGCRLCQSCVTGLLSPDEKRRCPGNTEACRDPDEPDTEVSRPTCFPDMATRRELAKVRVRCPNCDAGCSVELAWARMDEHVRHSCDFEKLRCELCDQHVMKKDMQRHTATQCRQRKETCDLCSQQVRVSELETRHRNLESDACCPIFTAYCPHCLDRSRKLDRRAYEAHVGECLERPVECKYSHLGCGARVRRSEVEQHYRDCRDSHLELMDSRLGQANLTPVSQTSTATSPAATTNGREVADVKRRVGSVFDQFKKLQVNVANWAHSTMELEQMADRFGGVSQLRTLLSSLDERTRCVEELQQQVQQLQQQVQQLQQHS